MASINLGIDLNDKTPWGDVMREKAPASAGAGTPQKAPASAGAGTSQMEKGWKAPKGKKTKSRTENSAPAGSVAKTLDFGGKYADPNNKFAILAWSDSE